MDLQKPDLDELTELALRAAKEAAVLIQEKAGHSLAIEPKTGGNTLASQVVTEVDLASQDRILEVLEPSFSKFDLGILTEESQDDSSRFSKDSFWCIDPLDGTLPFTENRPGYSVSIALVSREGVPQLGVIIDPRSGNTFHAQFGCGTFRNDSRMGMAPVPTSSDLTWIMDRSFRKIPNFSELQTRIETLAMDMNLQGVKIIDHGGAAMNAIWVLENAPAVYFKFPKLQDGGGSLWDYAATACIFNELEIPPTDVHGSPLELNRTESTFMNHSGAVYASSLELAESVRQIYRLGA